LEQVLLNLYLNAIDAMPEGGKLTVGAKVEESDGTMAPMLVITVADTGFGIDEKDLPKIFLPFFTAKKRKGLGLGLPICERIVKNHGGEIEVKSHPGGGTTFSICLPLQQRDNSKDSAATVNAEDAPVRG
jgi:signal transduction histidine kinase